MHVLSLKDLSLSIKSLLENTFDNIKVKGEAVQPKRHTSGHLYFYIKDGDYILDCVSWRSAKLTFEPQDGAEIICTGKISSYFGRSKYQMIVTEITHSGIGALMKMIEDRKKRLREDGLFESPKPPIPAFPKTIGIATSATGAVIHDMLHRLNGRYACDVILYPIPVQGPEMPTEASKAIRYFIEKSVDVIILARGGGSFEDLIGFNDENLVRLIAQSPIPIVTAIGHETDTTLVDYVSSLRAPTPTAAIELITPHKDNILSSLDSLWNSIETSLNRMIKNFSLILSKSNFTNAESYLQYAFQRMDYASNDFSRAIGNYIKISERKINIKINPPSIKSSGDKIIYLFSKIELIFKNKLQSDSKNIENVVKLLYVSSYKQTLKRGFCRAFHSKVGSINSVKSAMETERFSIEFYDGDVPVYVKK